MRKVLNDNDPNPGIHTARVATDADCFGCGGQGGSCGIGRGWVG